MQSVAGSCRDLVEADLALLTIPPALQPEDGQGGPIWGSGRDAIDLVIGLDRTPDRENRRRIEQDRVGFRFPPDDSFLRQRDVAHAEPADFRNPDAVERE